MIQWQLIGRHRNLAMLVILTLPIILCSGCSSRTPSCTSEDVKGLVLDISMEELRNQILGSRFSSAPGIPDDVKYAAAMEGLKGGIKYDDVVKLKGKIPGIENLLSVVDKEVAATKINLINITLGEKYPDMKKCECGGVLSFPNGKKLNINYTAQFTEDGKLQVAVSGLKGF